MFETVYKVRIVYKSGYTHDFECTEFTISKTEMSWDSANKKHRPLKIGIDDIAAVWGIGERRRFRKFW